MNVVYQLCITKPTWENHEADLGRRADTQCMRGGHHGAEERRWDRSDARTDVGKEEEVRRGGRGAGDEMRGMGMRGVPQGEKGNHSGRRTSTG